MFTRKKESSRADILRSPLPTPCGQPKKIWSPLSNLNDHIFYFTLQGCISCGMCSYPELTKDHVLTSAYVNIFRTVTRNAVNKSVWRKKDCFWLPLNKHTMNIFIQISNSPRTRARFSENQSAHRLENRKTSPCSPCAPNLLHVLVSWIPGYHNLCSPEQ